MMKFYKKLNYIQISIFFKDGKPNDEYIAFLKNDIRINFLYMRSSRTSLAREKHAIDSVFSSLYMGMYNIYDFKQTEKLIKFHRVINC